MTTAAERITAAERNYRKAQWLLGTEWDEGEEPELLRFKVASLLGWTPNRSGRTTRMLTQLLSALYREFKEEAQLQPLSVVALNSTHARQLQSLCRGIAASMPCPVEPQAAEWLQGLFRFVPSYEDAERVLRGSRALVFLDHAVISGYSESWMRREETRHPLLDYLMQVLHFACQPTDWRDADDLLLECHEAFDRLQAILLPKPSSNTDEKQMLRIQLPALGGLDHSAILTVSMMDGKWGRVRYLDKSFSDPHLSARANMLVTGSNWMDQSGSNPWPYHATGSYQGEWFKLSPLFRREETDGKNVWCEVRANADEAPKLGECAWADLDAYLSVPVLWGSPLNPVPILRIDDPAFGGGYCGETMYQRAYLRTQFLYYAETKKWTRMFNVPPTGYGWNTWSTTYDRR